MYSGAMRIQDAAELTYEQIMEADDDAVKLKGQKTEARTILIDEDIKDQVIKLM